MEDLSQSALFCTACACSLGDVVERMSHYKTEWHRYNIKRRCASLPPVPRELFDQKLQALAAEKERERGAAFSCALCKKDFASQPAFDQHMQTRKHQKAEEQASYRRAKQQSTSQNDSGATADSHDANDAAEAEAETETEAVPMETEDVQDQKEPVPVKTCLFCDSSHETVRGCLSHMLKTHGFFIPFVEHLADVDSLLEYLGHKVGVGHVCLYCNGRGRAAFDSLHGVRQHMIAKSHCKLRMETEEDEDEFAEFYAFEEDDENAGDEEPEEREEAAPVTDVIVKADADRSAGVSMNDLGELVMANGSVIGHRSLRTYYKQQLKPRPRDAQLLDELSGAYRALTLPGYSDKLSAQRPAFLARVQAKQQMKLGIKRNNQKHHTSQIFW